MNSSTVSALVSSAPCFSSFPCCSLFLSFFSIFLLIWAYGAYLPDYFFTSPPSCIYFLPPSMLSPDPLVRFLVFRIATERGISHKSTIFSLIYTLVTVIIGAFVIQYTSELGLSVIQFMAPPTPAVALACRRGRWRSAPAHHCVTVQRHTPSFPVI